MSTCTRCGASFSCAMVDAGPDGKLPTEPCWCTYFPPAVPVPELPAAPVGDAASVAGKAVGCWCAACLKDHIAQKQVNMEGGAEATRAGR
ncbi:cysteine-rich CWC family protein [Massilia sp. BJB1822]|uniref:cysteine-rich CWC family protein n=1 Tax=Massilia sp. BJB1822 TaxID=2744470 RepID=UPI0015943329|nr:cysteine-rich CWC family protein [Massilia sp. BJB1822]NVD96781.1 cysteine-rich CWC family protein [Massilia sp. BJB1822]